MLGEAARFRDARGDLRDAFGEGRVQAAVAQIGDEVLRHERAAGGGVSVRAGERGIDTPVRRSTPRDLFAALDDGVFEFGEGLLLIAFERVGAGAEADGRDLIGLRRDGARLARLGLVDRGGHDDAGAVALDRAVGGELEARAAGVFEQRAKNFVAALEIRGGAVELAGPFFEESLAERRLGRGFR